MYTWEDILEKSHMDVLYAVKLSLTKEIWMYTWEHMRDKNLMVVLYTVQNYLIKKKKLGCTNGNTLWKESHIHVLCAVKHFLNLMHIWEHVIEIACYIYAPAHGCSMCKTFSQKGTLDSPIRTQLTEAIWMVCMQ